MAFKEKYSINRAYLDAPSKRRPGLRMPAVKFLVAHDTGNPGSTATGNVRYYQNSRNELSASAHLFVDDKVIVECIPALTGPPEKAWHVLYNAPADNQLFGYNANDAALSVEYCYGKGIDADNAYRRYVWVLACLCYRFELDPATRITGHHLLDPRRKTDPVSGLVHSRRTFEQLLRDVADEYRECTGTAPAPAYDWQAEAGRVRTTVKLNLREAPTTLSRFADTVLPHQVLHCVAFTDRGQPIGGNARWYQLANGQCLWGGGVREITSSLPPGDFVAAAGSIVSLVKLNVRLGAPSTLAPIVKEVQPNQPVPYVGWVADGESINGIAKWFRDAEGNYFWSGARHAANAPDLRITA